ncbi:MAG: hypothetical protein AAF333_19360 [Planctomycetota bacterium]
MLYRAISLITLLFAGPCLSAEAQQSSPTETYVIALVGENLSEIAGAKLSVLNYVPEVNGLRALRNVNVVFDDQGRCKVALAPGRYVFEVLTQTRSGTLVALRTPPTTPRPGRAVELAANSPIPLEVLAGGHRIDLDFLTIRSIALEGALVWKATSGQPLVILSPNQRYKLGILGHHDTRRFAYWLSFRTGEMRAITLPANRSHRTKIRWRPETVLRDVGRAARVTLHYPDTVWDFEVVNETELLTNRRFVEMSYSYPTTDGRKITLYPKGYRVDRHKEIYLGGPLSEHAYVGVHRHYGGDRYERRLTGVFWLEDPGGHTVKISASKIKVEKRLVRVNGQALPPNPLAKDALNQLRPLSENLRLEVTYRLDGLRQVSLKPGEAEEVRSQYFVMQAVPGWEWRNKIYLARAERAYDMLRPITAYPGSSRIKIGWLTNRSRARGGWQGKRTGNKRGFINMPFIHYWTGVSLFTHTPFLTHEVAHTYGYSHGDAMSAVQREAERRYREFGWFVVDHPNYLPDVQW